MTPSEQLPTGTVTFLFTDIEGSTNLAQKYPDALPELLDRHNAILQDCIRGNHGVVFRMAGDAFCAAFPTPGDAFAAALTGQRELQTESWQPVPVMVRMGLHTGEARTRPAGSEMDPYIGYLTLTRVQRVMASAHGGQVLLSNATATMVRESLPPDVSLRDLGPHRLKGLPDPEPLWQVVAPDLRTDFSSLATLDAIPSNLPVVLSRLVGRTRELAEVKQRLAQNRLVTLLGPGGTGKTRLSLQVGADLMSEFGDRVYFIDLAPTRDAEAVLVEIGRVIGLRESSDAPLLQELKAYIGNKKMLLLMDNFEQVMVAAPVVAELVRDCPELRMLVTSREALHVRGEQVLPIPPLSLPRIDAKRLTVEQVGQFEAVQLFMDRARAVQPDLELTQENAQAITEICLRLDGLPLAIELATARLNVLTPQAMAERLGNRLKLLRGGALDLPTRQQTLQSTIGWSYEMLDASEQALFKFLSVFNGATLEAIEKVAGRVTQPELAGLDILDGVDSLGDKSLLQQTEVIEGQARLRMLETIREFAAARLDETPELREAARRAHATYFADFTKGQFELLRSSGRERAIQRLTVDLENIKIGWRYWVALQDLEQLGKFTNTLWMLYDARGWYHETIQLINDLLRVLGSTVSTPERAREEIVLQTGLARALLAATGFTPEVEKAYARALELCETVGEVPQIFPVMRGLAFFYILRGEYDRGIEMGKRMLEVAERQDDVEMRIAGHLVVGENLASAGDVTLGMEHLDRVIALFAQNQLTPGRAGVGSSPGVVAHVISALFLWIIGFPDQARKRAKDGVELAQKLDHPFSLTYARYHYAFLLIWLREYALAEEQGRIVMDLADEYDFQLWSAAGGCVRGAAMAEMGFGDEGLALIERGIAAYRGPKSPPVFLPLLLWMNAAAYLAVGRAADGVPLLKEAAQIGSSFESALMNSEFMTLMGQLMVSISPEQAAEGQQWLAQSLDNARQVGATMLELRAAIPLSRILQSQGKRQEARRVLSDVYSKFTEGFETADLKSAAELLAELSREA